MLPIATLETEHQEKQLVLLPRDPLPRRTWRANEKQNSLCPEGKFKSVLLYLPRIFCRYFKVHNLITCDSNLQVVVSLGS